MPKDLTRYTVLLSSPGDAVSLCEAADRAIRSVNRSLSDETGVEFYSTDWRRDSRADSGDEPQALLNRQIVNDADIVLAIFFRRFGSPTRRYESGTEEEIHLGLQQKKTVLLYIWEPPENYEPTGSDQLAPIQRLKADLGKSVMYKAFSDESDLETKVGHDLTALMLELEGGGRPSKPALSLRSIDAWGHFAPDGTFIKQDLTKNYPRADMFDDIVRRTFDEVVASPIHKPKSASSLNSGSEGAAESNGVSDISASGTFGELNSGIVAAASHISSAWEVMKPEPLKFGEDKMLMVVEQLTDLGLEVPEDLFYVGSLGTVPSLVSINGPNRTLEGTDEEKTKYKLLRSLVEMCRLRRDYRAFCNSFEANDDIAFVLANDGGQPATHVSVEVLIPTDALVPHDKAPVPSDYFIGDILDEDENLSKFVEHLYAIEKSPTHRAYDASIVMYESGGRIAPIHQRFDNPIYERRKFDQGDFSEEVDYLFSDFERVEDHASGMTVVRLSFDRVQQNVVYAFPTILIVRDDFAGPIRYRITADELPSTVEGKLSMNAQKKTLASTAAGEPAGKEGKRVTTGEINASCSPHLKPMLTVAGQIAHLKSKGVSFVLCSEEQAASYLTDKTYLFKVSAYRELFEKRVGGERDGQYVGLDFGNLCELASLDRDLRYVLLPMTLDVEHYARVKLVREATARDDEDGYSIVSDYIASLSHDERRRREGEVNMLKPDAYCGSLVAKYHLPDDMPLWVFMELVSFGSFISLYLFCANPWGGGDMRDEHYLLRQVKACRNAAAHSSNMINGFGIAEGAVATNAKVSRALAEAGVSKRVRQSKMRNPRLQQIVTLLFLHTRIVPDGTSRERARGDLRALSTSMRCAMKSMSDNDAIQSSLGFLVYLFDKWF